MISSNISFQKYLNLGRYILKKIALGRMENMRLSVIVDEMWQKKEL
jgi:hypothetical protein